MGTQPYFDIPKVTRLIALGKPHNEILPHFLSLVKNIIHSTVSFDNRNHTEEDLIQVGLIKAQEVIEKFQVEQGGLFPFATTLIKHAIWSEARLRPLDHQRSTEDINFDLEPAAPAVPAQTLKLDSSCLKHLRLEGNTYQQAAEYIFGVLTSNDYESNRARVLKTLTHGYDINPKHARFLMDHVMVTLRVHYSKGVVEIRDDPMFANRFKHTLILEIRQLLGERAFERMIHYFGGLTISIPSVEQIASIDRDMAILKALALDWTCGPTLSKKYGISPEGIKAVYKACLHKIHTDVEYAALVAEHMPLSSIPGVEVPQEIKAKKLPMPTFGEKKVVPRCKIMNTDSMGFTLGCRNSLLYTLLITGKCTRQDLVKVVLSKFGGTESAAKATVSAFLSDIKHPFGKFNTSRNLKLVVDPKGRLSFERKSLIAAQEVIMAKRQSQVILQVTA
jgi:hypothetical protein